MTVETFHGKVFYVLHMEFDVKGKKLLSKRSDRTENKLTSFEFHSRPIILMQENRRPCRKSLRQDDIQQQPQLTLLPGCRVIEPIP